MVWRRRGGGQRRRMRRRSGDEAHVEEAVGLVDDERLDLRNDVAPCCS